MSRAVQLVLLSVVVLTCLQTGVAQDVQNEMSREYLSIKPLTHNIHVYMQMTQQVKL